MKQPSFLDRRTLGPPNYLLIATAAAFVLGLMPYGFWQALKTNTNALETWLPARYAEQRDLAWFRHQFLGEHFVVVSWDGCTLGNTEQLNSLARRLRPGDEAAGAVNADAADRTELFAQILTGPEMIDQLTAGSINLSRAEAIRRLEGVMVGPMPRTGRARAAGDEARATCLVAFLSEAASRDSRAVRSAIDAITHVAVAECGVPAEAIRLGGPPVQEVAISTAAERGLILGGPMAAIGALCLCYFCLRSWLLAGLTVGSAVVAACMSLALVYYFGAIEVFAMRLPAPRWGTTDAVILVMPLVVYVIALAAGLFLVNYYLAARLEFGVAGAAELAVRQGWLASLIVAIAAAVAIGSFAAGDVAPIHKFGAFSAASVLSAISLLYALVPVVLHRFPPNLRRAPRSAESGDQAAPSGRLHRLVEGFIRNSGLTAAASAVVMIALGAGVMYLSVSGRPMALLAGDSSSRRDYAWLEQNVANLMPVEIVVTAAPERMREPGQSPEQDGQQYRMTLLERLELVQLIHARVEAVTKVSGALSAATFIPADLDFAGQSGRPASPQLADDVRQQLVDADLLQMERSLESGAPTGRELWHIAGRVSAVAAGDNVAVDYNEVMRQLRQAVDPVLEAYERRDEIVRQLSARGRQLAGARIAILYRGAPSAEDPVEGSDALTLGRLLQRSGTADGGVTYVNMATLELAAADERAASDDAVVPMPLTHQDAVVVMTSAKGAVDELGRRGVSVVDLSLTPTVEESASVNLAAMPGPRPVRAVFTGMAPLLEGTQQDVVEGFAQSLLWAGSLVFGVLMIALWSPVGALLAMLPIALPVAVTYGVMGWMGLRVDIGTVLTASAGVGVALMGTVHYLIWFQRASKIGYSRKESALIAFDRCAAPMLQTFIVAGLSLAVLAFANFAPLQQLGYLAPAQLALALICVGALLPAMVAGPLGRFFGGVAESRTPPAPEKPDSAPQHGEPDIVRPRRAGAVRVDAGGRSHVAAADERQDAAEPSHANLQERLQRLRRRPGDSPS